MVETAEMLLKIQLQQLLSTFQPTNIQAARDCSLEPVNIDQTTVGEYQTLHPIKVHLPWACIALST